MNSTSKLTLNVYSQWNHTCTRGAQVKLYAKTSFTVQMYTLTSFIQVGLLTSAKCPRENTQVWYKK